MDQMDVPGMLAIRHAVETTSIDPILAALNEDW